MMFSAQNSQVSSNAIYVDDVFSTYLYTGNGSTQTITNGINLAGKGGLTLIKCRNTTEMPWLFDTVRGSSGNVWISSSDVSVYSFPGYGVNSFTSSGFSVNGGSGYAVNTLNNTYASWTFRKQPKFFDVQSVTKTAGVTKTVDLSTLGTVGAVIVKRTDSNSNLFVWHRSQTAGSLTYLNLTNAQTADSTISVSGTTLTIAASVAAGTYIVYALAHDAGGFGASGTDNVISCGSITDVSQQVALGWEPQFVLYKTIGTTGNWNIFDNMRGMTADGSGAYLQANSSAAEATASGQPAPNATGFYWSAGTGSTVIYIAIRRPHKPPTSGTQVFSPVARTGTSANATVTCGFTADAVIVKARDNTTPGFIWGDRLRGAPYLQSSSTAAEVTATTIFQANPWDVQDGVKIGSGAIGTNASTATYINYFLKRAPSVFDAVCYTGTGTAQTLSHNLGVAPELIIVKKRDVASTSGWLVGSATTGFANKMYANLTNASASDSTAWNSTAPTASAFTVGTNTDSNASGAFYVAYLFATLAGVSKVGTYTGNGFAGATANTIDCGFAAGARFVLIKRTSLSGDWFVWDTARGIVSAGSPYLKLNSTAIEATDKSIYPSSTGFIVSQLTATNINVSGATYIYIAIA